jgi:hypothetical protein
LPGFALFLPQELLQVLCFIFGFYHHRIKRMRGCPHFSRFPLIERPMANNYCTVTPKFSFPLSIVYPKTAYRTTGVGTIHRFSVKIRIRQISPVDRVLITPRRDQCAQTVDHFKTRSPGLCRLTGHSLGRSPFRP